MYRDILNIIDINKGTDFGKWRGAHITFLINDILYIINSLIYVVFDIYFLYNLLKWLTARFYLFMIIKKHNTSQNYNFTVLHYYFKVRNVKGYSI